VLRTNRPAVTNEETRLFKLLDNYARSQHRCFLTELFMNQDHTRYFLCFRPQGPLRDESERFACVYLQIDLEEARAIYSQRALTTTVVRDMDEKLSKLGREA
jgi:hypothetical protein